MSADPDQANKKQDNGIIAKIRRAPRILAFALISGIVVIAVLLTPGVPGFFETRIQTIDRDFDGVFVDDRPASSSTPSQLQQPTKTIHLLIVHGIGRHCIGYADSLATGIARQAGLQFARPEAHLFAEEDCDQPIKDYNQFEESQLEKCELINNQDLADRTCQWLGISTAFDEAQTGSTQPSQTFPGYIRIQDYRHPHASNLNTTLRLYELTWDPATRWAKSYYVSRVDSEFDDAREFFNRQVKRQVINESISDAVLYLGDYRPVMLYPILMAFCKILSDVTGISTDNKNESEFSCMLDRIAAELNKNENYRTQNEIAIITHSLGSRMVFDALGAVGGVDFVKKTQSDLAAIGVQVGGSGFADVTDEQTKKMGHRFRELVSKVFALSNQVPLLELGAIENPASFNLKPDLGEQFAEFLEVRIKNPDAVAPLQIVAFTDPNDLLSYNLKCWYYLRVLRHHDGLESKGSKNRHFFNTYFDNCMLSNRDPLYSEKLGMREDFWGLADPYVTITDVSANLAGLGYPLVFADPSSAHSQYFDDEEIYKFIACGGMKEPQKAKECPAH